MTNASSSGLIDSPHRGVETWVNPHAIRIFRLHYTADEFKATPEWITREKASITDPQNWEREYEINAKAKLGQQIYQLDEIATLEKSFVIPEHWTRYFALDPHPRVPHGSLWAAVDPYGDIWIYRELWPSRMHGKPGNIPEDDNRYSIKDYVAAVRWLESKDNPENDETRERIWRRVIDYAARAFGKGTTDDEEQPNFQVRFEEHMSGRCECKCESITSARFEDAKKDHEIGIACVNEWLKPLTVEVDGKPAKKSRLHIFADRCPELIYELRTNRYKRLTPAMADQHDPSSLPVEKRNHLTDCIAEGQAVTTHRGEIPIEKVVPGDFALTRLGWKRVTDAWFVRNAPVVAVELSDGRSLVATRDHRLATQRGWVSIDSLRYGDTLVSCEAKSSYGIAGDIGATQTHPDRLTVDTSVSQAEKGAATCIAIYGLRVTAQFRRAATYITRMATLSTTPSKISNAFRRAITLLSTPLRMGGPNGSLHCPASGIWPLNGMVASPVTNGTRQTLDANGSYASQSTRRVATAASGLRLRTTSSESTPSAAMGARRSGDTTPVLITSSASALTAANHSPLTNTARAHLARSCAASVSAVRKAGSANVYDLTVEDAHEFVVNGIVVHNCLRYLCMAKPEFVPPVTHVESTWQPLVKGVAF